MTAREPGASEVEELLDELRQPGAAAGRDAVVITSVDRRMMGRGQGICVQGSCIVYSGAAPPGDVPR